MSKTGAMAVGLAFGMLLAAGSGAAMGDTGVSGPVLPEACAAPHDMERLVLACILAGASADDAREHTERSCDSPNDVERVICLVIEIYRQITSGGGESRGAR